MCYGSAMANTAITLTHEAKRLLLREARRQGITTTVLIQRIVEGYADTLLGTPDRPPLDNQARMC
jgi:hypothetical protein